MRSISPKNKNNSAFTLVELSIGVVVIGILIGIAFMGLGNSREDAQAQKRSAVISSVEAAKNRYYLSSPNDVLGEATRIEHIAPLLNINGENVDSIFDLVQGTGRKENELDLGSYQVRPANFGNGGNTASGTGGTYPSFNDFLTANGGSPGMNPSQYNPIIQDALDNNIITEEDIRDWGFDDYLGTWLPQPRQRRRNHFRRRWRLEQPKPRTTRRSKKNPRRIF
jgi:prepilin-type N-terminal cleavage/methylation domain-containing protein